MVTATKTKPPTVEALRKAIRDFKAACAAVDRMAELVCEAGGPRLSRQDAIELTGVDDLPQHWASVERLWSALTFGDIDNSF